MRREGRGEEGWGEGRGRGGRYKVRVGGIHASVHGGYLCPKKKKKKRKNKRETGLVLEIYRRPVFLYALTLSPTLSRINVLTHPFEGNCLSHWLCKCTAHTLPTFRLNSAPLPVPHE